MSAYTNADVALVANYVPLGFTERDPYRNVNEAARAILDAVAPAIAARAKAESLREAADAIRQMQVPTCVGTCHYSDAIVLDIRAAKAERT